MSPRDFLLNDFAPFVRKYGWLIAVIIVAAGTIAIFVFTKDEGQKLPDEFPVMAAKPDAGR